MLDAVQWPAMVVTVLAAWLVASKSEAKRNWGFWAFLTSNVLWVAWGAFAAAWALVVLQICLAALNVRGAIKNSSQSSHRASRRAPIERAERPDTRGVRSTA